MSGTDHRIWFGGSAPCDEHGRKLTMANPEARAIADGLQASFMLSSKPASEGYPDEYTKVTTYARIIAHQAQAIDPSATAAPGAAWQEIDDHTPFAYRDTATSRAGLAAVNRRYRGQRIAIVGLGGTGSYILDQVPRPRSTPSCSSTATPSTTTTPSGHPARPRSARCGAARTRPRTSRRSTRTCTAASPQSRNT